MHEGTDRERGQCSAGESGLLSLSVQGGEGTLHSGSGAAAAAGAEKEEREWETEGGGGDREEEKEMSRRRVNRRLNFLHVLLGLCHSIAI